MVVTPNPNTAGSIATYTIANAKASAAMTGGSSTIALQGPGRYRVPQLARRLQRH